MFKKFWTSNWPKVLFAQIAAMVLVVGMFLVSTYGFQVVNHIKAFGYTALVSMLVLFAVLIACSRKPYPTLLFLNALGVAVVSVPMAVLLEPTIFSGSPIVITAIFVVGLVFLSAAKMGGPATKYGLTEWLLRSSYVAECLITLGLLILLQHTSLLPASL